jgi:peptidoglycan/LPS O-acetylase OafA/YrhL
VAATVLLTLVALTAIVAVVRGELGEVEGRIITSALILLAAAALASIGLDAWSRGTALRAGPVAAAAAAASAVLWLVVIWADVDSVPAWQPRSATIAALAAGAAALHSALATWARRPRWLIIVATVLGYACAAEAAVIIARDDATTPEVRGLAAGAIALALALVLIPITARLGSRRSEAGA